MCGIAGIFDKSNTLSSGELGSIVKSMRDAIAHRGPDADDCWIDISHHMGFAHTRLSIIDLSEAGAQPMLASDQKTLITYNGEVYNSDELRRELVLDGITLRGYSDTEVILEACVKWGVENTVQRLVGMFAFAIYNSQTGVLNLVRDRVGIKPLYWADIKSAFLFGSELSAIECYPDFSIKVNSTALASYFRKGCIEGKQSIANDCFRLEPGTMLTRTTNGDIRIKRYWHGNSFDTKGCATKTENTSDYIDELEQLLTEAISIRTIADVPLGAFLSGGIDSSTVVALMQKVSSTPVNTFSIGFSESDYDESSHAALIADHVGTNHTQLVVTAQDALDAIRVMHKVYDEPFADASQIPTYLLSKLTREYVTVALSGDGGDELFAGYSRYYHALKMRESLSKIPTPISFMVGKSIKSIPRPVFQVLAKFAPEKYRTSISGDKIPTLAELMIKQDDRKLYNAVSCHFNNPEELVPGVPKTTTSIDEGEIINFLRHMQRDDLNGYLPDDILTKLDRASMFVGLEARVPILDHRIIEFAAKLPNDVNYRNGEGKWILKEVLYRHVPKELVDRPKMGFGAPIGVWLRNELHDWADDLLHDKAIRQIDLLDYNSFDRKWDQHRKKIANWEYHLWDVLMLHGWLRHRRDKLDTS